MSNQILKTRYVKGLQKYAEQLLEQSRTDLQKGENPITEDVMLFEAVMGSIKKIAKDLSHEHGLRDISHLASLALMGAYIIIEAENENPKMAGMAAEWIADWEKDINEYPET